MVCVGGKIKEDNVIEKNGGRVEFYLRSGCQESFSDEKS